ncbi:PHP domain-containing protein [Barrientosiimonas endolithica]|uniref:Polymerase/histidinol phosphatase N-terminal domain-containing protein n=1 Tax=Barrientosiimonas endolithica TaxID=1535208 RepID=A0ABM8HA23_9MICO|nr:PHP domain-containing protein [Barrientosiimonas endolithica]BDZ57780.1 hypothetical protein GCM10025872_14370 [Barrientosiimonas endolithica]
MSAEFSHLHVASSFSLRYGASPPAELVARAVEQGQGRLALTDRDGLYGAVRFAQACHEARVEPVLGVDLALRPSPVQPPPAAGGARRRSAPVKGGALRDDQHPRITVLARGQQAGLAPGAGWAALCRVVSATHLAGSADRPARPRRAGPVGRHRWPDRRWPDRKQRGRGVAPGRRR